MNYLEWLSAMVIPDESIRYSYQKVLEELYLKEFRWSISGDENRAEDGIVLRDIFRDEMGSPANASGPCSCLEMMVALSLRCENELMYDPDEGDRIDIWFWDMFENLGLDRLDDWRFDEATFNKIMDHFLDRKYDKDGYGGLFFIEGFERDMRKIEIWYQLNYFLRSKYLW